jgi:hypothetical protein
VGWGACIRIMLKELGVGGADCVGAFSPLATEVQSKATSEGTASRAWA